MAYDIRKDKNPMAVNILKLQRYNFDFFSLEEVVLFEYLIIKGKAFQFKPFYHSSATIAAETGIKRNKLDSIVKKFILLQLIKVELKGFPKVKHWLVNYPAIPPLFDKIYKFAEIGKLTVENSKLLDDFYKPFVDSYQKKNNKEETIKELKKEDSKEGDGVAFLCLRIQELLFTLKKQFLLTEEQVTFTDDQLVPLLKNYDFELIKQMISRYFQSNPGTATVFEFLKTDKLFTNKNNYIEGQIWRDYDFACEFIRKLEETFNNRRKVITNARGSKKTLPQTKIVVNDDIIKKVGAALKEKGELAIHHAFIAYADEVLNDKLSVQKLLPYFFSKDSFSEYSVIDKYLDLYNLQYLIRK